MAKVPLIINRLPPQRMGRKASIRWITNQLLDILAADLGTSSQELGLVLSQKERLALPVLAALDELIVIEAHGLGRRILLSPLAMLRYLAWEAEDNFNLSRRFHAALKKHWEILHRGAKPPLPVGMRVLQKEMVSELRQVSNRMRKRFQAVTRPPTLGNVLDAFDQAVADLGSPHLSHPVNWESWRKFLAWSWQNNPTPLEAFRTLLLSLRTPSQLFRQWVAWSLKLNVNTIDYYFSHGKIR